MGRDAVTGLVVLAASLALFWGTLGLERHPMVPVGPGFYPRIVLAITAAFALVLVVADVVSRRKPVARAVPPAVPPANYALVLVAFGIFAAYVVMLPWLGFRVGSLAFLAAMQVALERPSTARGWLRVAAVSIVATVVTYLVFESYLHVLLPRGRWTGF
ncbi:MAG: tripartite tricarboxylate transporter TctB family protein [Pseudomonadota bacterium]|nr:tripartite tricarboxylate transporter TctB family protein [Pseudomonadota bacterium]